MKKNKMKIKYRIMMFWMNILLCVLQCSFPQIAAAEAKDVNLDLYARSAVLMDADAGRILVEKNAREILPNASTTKILTCIVALEEEGDNLQQIVTVSGEAASMPRVHLGMRKGELYVLKDLLYSLMLESHNDSAVAIAEAVGGSTEKFAVMMNRKAEEIGCKNTFFITPNGLDASVEVTRPNGQKEQKQHSTTAEDLARIMSYCIMDSPQKELFLEITRTGTYTFHNRIGTENEVSIGSRTFTCQNHNAFLQMMDGALSGKTGYTGNASYCYVGALERDGRTFVVALLSSGWPGHKNYKWSDTRKLMEYGIANYQYQNIRKEIRLNDILVEEGIGLWRASPFEKAYTTAEIDAYDGAIEVLLGQMDQVDILVDYSEKLTAPVKKGQKIGKVEYYLNDQIYRSYDILISQSIEKLNYKFLLSYILKQYFLC